MAGNIRFARATRRVGAVSTKVDRTHEKDRNLILMVHIQAYLLSFSDICHLVYCHFYLARGVIGSQFRQFTTVILEQWR